MIESSHCFFLILKFLTPVSVDLYLILSFLVTVNIAILLFNRFVLVTIRDLLTKNPIPNCLFRLLSRIIWLKGLFLFPSTESFFDS